MSEEGTVINLDLERRRLHISRLEGDGINRWIFRLEEKKRGETDFRQTVLVSSLPLRESAIDLLRIVESDLGSHIPDPWLRENWGGEDGLQAQIITVLRR